MCRDDCCGSDPQFEDRSCGHFLYGHSLPSVCRLCHHSTQHAGMVVSSVMFQRNMPALPLLDSTCLGGCICLPACHHSTQHARMVVSFVMTELNMPGLWSLILTYRLSSFLNPTCQLYCYSTQHAWMAASFTSMAYKTPLHGPNAVCQRC